jgi:hypothetical protein
MKWLLSIIVALAALEHPREEKRRLSLILVFGFCPT